VGSPKPRCTLDDTQTVLSGTESRSESHLIWEVPGKPVSVHFELDALTRLGREILRGFGVVPRRSVEVGGILLGKAEPAPGGNGWTVFIEDFEPVACRHRNGPAYQLVDEDLARFEELLAPWKAAEGRRIYAVGFYRSHVREGFSLSSDDLELFQNHFSSDWNMALLVKPFATRPSVGGFFFRENGIINADAPYKEFPIRLRDHESEGTAATASVGTKLPADMTLRQIPTAAGDAAEITPSGKKDPRWVWIPLSFVFLLLGVGLGFWLGLSLKTPPSQVADTSARRLSLWVQPRDGGLRVQWDRSSWPIQTASGGKLLIDEGGRQKTVDLDVRVLRNGSIQYNQSGTEVTFRMEVYTADGSSVAESVRSKK